MNAYLKFIWFCKQPCNCLSGPCTDTDKNCALCLKKDKTTCATCKKGFFIKVEGKPCEGELPLLLSFLYSFREAESGAQALTSSSKRSTSVAVDGFRRCLWTKYTVYPKKYAHGFCFAVLCCGYTLTDWLIFPYPSRLLHWHCGNLTIAPVPAKQPWWIWINTSCEFIMNDCITTTKQSTTKPCTYFLGYTVVRCHYNTVQHDKV